jgi:YegS/Rv2252/BmrU family lipid kinase
MNLHAMSTTGSPPQPALVIVNPRAGGGVSERRWARFVGAVSSGLGEVDVCFTEARGHARELARDAALAGRALVVAFGGDGTISEVAGGLLSTAAGPPAAGAGATTTATTTATGSAPLCALGIIPRGTGGDFRRTLELPHDIAQAAARIRDSAPRVVDVGRVSFTTAEGLVESRTFVNVASFGFSSNVAERANHASKAFGAKAAFLGATLRTLASYDNNEVFLEIDGRPPVRRTLMLAAVGKGRYFGGGMKICPEARLDSGALSLVLVGDLGKMEVVANLHRLFAGTHLTLDDVRSLSIQRLTARPVAPDQLIPVELDGETPGHLPATFEVLPRALRIRF